MALDVVGLGLACVDDLLLLSNVPRAEERASVLRRDLQGGGMAATAMVAVARLGGRAGFVGRVGDDQSGEFILQDFRRYGVDVSRVVVEPGATSHLTVVLVDARDGARSFLGQRGTVRPLQPEDVRRDYVTSGRLLHLSDADPAALQAARWARAAGREVCFDGTHFYPAVLELLPLLEYVIVSRFFASELVAFQETGALTRAARMFSQPGGGIGAPVPGVPGAKHLPGGQRAEPPQNVSQSPGEGERRSPEWPRFTEGVVPELRGEALLGAARRIQALGPPVAVVTEGEHGSWCAAPEGEFHTPAFPVTPVVDTTGAGDVFHGAFLYARAQGWSLRRALRLGSAVGALKCRALGGRVGIPALEEALALAEGASTPG